MLVALKEVIHLRNLSDRAKEPILILLICALTTALFLIVTKPAIEIATGDHTTASLWVMFYPIGLFFIVLSIFPRWRISCVCYVISGIIMWMLVKGLISYHFRQTVIRDIDFGIPYVSGTAERLIFGIVLSFLSWWVPLIYSLWRHYKRKFG